MEQHKILIVDDAFVIRKIVREMLLKMGAVDIVESDSGGDAWKLLLKSIENGDDFGLVISDWNMAGMTGLKLLTKIKTCDELKHIPFLMLTAESESECIQQAIQAGVDCYLTKPFTYNSLSEKVIEILEKK